MINLERRRAVGWCAEGDQGYAYGHRGPLGNFKPCVEMRFGIQIPGRKTIWYPEKPLPVLVDTGADTSCMSEVRMSSLGLRPSSGDPIEHVIVPKKGQRVKCRQRRQVPIRFSPFDTIYRININYSKYFPDDLILISWKDLVNNYYSPIIDRFNTYLFEFM